MGQTDSAAGTVPEVDYAFDPLVGTDLQDALAAARVRGPAVWVRFLGSDALLVTGFADVRDLLFEDDRLPGGEFHRAVTEPAVGPTFISMSGIEHDLHRKLATPAFRSRAVDRFDELDLVPLAHELVDGFVDRGEADLVTEFTTALPFAAITRKLGLPLSDYPQMRRWAEDLLSFPVDPEGARRAAEEVGAQIAPLLEARRLDPGEDILSGLLHAREGDEHLDDDEVFATTRLLFTVGATTTSHAMGNLLHAVLTRRDVYERACREPVWRAAVVHELLRCDGPVAILPRIATDDVEVLGERVSAGTMVLLALVAANRDPAVFERPDEFDPDRLPQEVLTFGFGRKFCPGKHLARRELITALDVLLERLPDLRLVDEEEARPRGGVLRHPISVRVTWG